MTNYSNLGSGQNGNNWRRGGRYRPMAEINVTPFVDVMLVLLVVFMITAPLLNSGVPLDLPESKAKPLTGNAEPLTVSIDREGRVYLMDKAISPDDLAPRLTAIAGNRGNDMRIFVRGDQTVDYGAVMRVMGILNAAGFRKVALVTTSVTKEK